jgi:hypothetical protein
MDDEKNNKSLSSGSDNDEAVEAEFIYTASPILSFGKSFLNQFIEAVVEEKETANSRAALVGFFESTIHFSQLAINYSKLGLFFLHGKTSCADTIKAIMHINNFIESGDYRQKWENCFGAEAREGVEILDSISDLIRNQKAIDYKDLRRFFFASASRVLLKMAPCAQNQTPESVPMN